MKASALAVCRGEGEKAMSGVFAAESSQKAEREEHSMGTCILPGSLSTTLSLFAPCLGIFFYDPIHLFAVSLRFALKFKS